MLKKSFNSLLTTWLAGLLVMLPLVLTLALLAWVVSLLNRFVGPSSLIGRASPPSASRSPAIRHWPTCSVPRYCW